MVIVMQEGATDEQIQHVIDRVVSSGFDVHRSTGASHTVLGAVCSRAFVKLFGLRSPSSWPAGSLSRREQLSTWAAA
jgi:DAHP synthase ferredoxin-like domain